MLKLKLIAGVMLLSMLTFVFAACAPAPAPAPTPAPAPAPAPATPTAGDVNFRFLISDDVNAIDDFEHIYVTISEIGVQRGGESGNWTEFTPDITEVNLKPLVEENALEIWSGNLTPGEYSKVFIYVSSINGTLTEDLGGAEANVKLPSEKLHISKPFVISENTTTSFVYDITVVKAGQSGQYILKPQIAQSGADQKFKEIKPEEGKEQEKPKELEFEGTIEAIDGTTWTVNIDGESRSVDVSDAEIEGEPDIGLHVEIEGIEENGDIVAKKVEVEELEDEDEEEEIEASVEVTCDEFASENQTSREIEVAAGELLMVTLCSNPTTGFQWSATANISDTAVLEQVSHEFIPPKSGKSPQVGASGQEVWVFRALEEGTSTVYMEYSRPWQGGEQAVWTFELTVTVE